MKNFISLFLFLALPAPFFSCKETSKTNTSTYELVKDWPQLPQGFSFSPVSGVGVDNQQNVFVFQRTGRKWTNPFPDSLISVNTVFLLDGATGKVLNSWGSNLFIMPHGLTVDRDNNVWVADVGLHQIFKFTHEGELLLKLGVAKTAGNDSTHFDLPTDIAIAEDGSFYVSDGYGNSRVLKFSGSGKYQFEWGKKGNNPGEFDIPHMIDLDSAGNVYVADRENNRIQKFDAQGKFMKEWKNDALKRLFALALGKKDGMLLAIDVPGDADTTARGTDILQLDTNLALQTRTIGLEIFDDSAIDFHDVATDADGNLYVCATGDQKVFKFRKISR